ncbi:hypothetical protein DVW31_11930 [Enterococcus faecium]|uniref:hypothetical protein n=1 Tax=Enterococcus TaxID=1350 RepID=UPI0009E2B64D|nr:MULTISPECIES: hypothetical protein [Enterococcus]AYQ25396.1 hypothetical protein AUF16_12865 [Enterococcus avium]EIY7148184.1 hypothetical protein [Enterococcus faecalis]EKZ0142545.1 hypothetical protein [Enterococcus faecalis]MCZ1262406.1 hypothetical protein [Enterococcus faecium]MCZ1374829.1 hypothetical protein [Enterococcus faecium]
MIEGTYDKKSGKYFYDFYSMKLDPKTKKSTQHRIYCTHVPVKVMYRRVRNYLYFLRKKQQSRNGKNA